MENVFITGGAGYLGRAILAEIQDRHPGVRCTVFSRDHSKHSACQRQFPDCRYIIGDIRDQNSLSMAMAGHDTVIHAGAFKYVPQGETNVIECHEINTMGSLNVIRAAMQHNVDRVIGLSTDKACSPINVYGITKLMMEKMFQQANSARSTQFNIVRYGNVVSSTGSAIPIFRRQARETGVIQLTNPLMTRFWLTVEQAVDLVMMALKETEGGTILIPRLPSLALHDVAKAAVLMEFGDDKDYAVDFKTIGQRFGEKVHEDLLTEVEAGYTEMVGNKIGTVLMRLHPTASSQCNCGVSRYSSDDPDRELSITEAIRMIREAPG